jgi:L-ascorbate metabolism protein UlaG (beta-lactamase superfamily)
LLIDPFLSGNPTAPITPEQVHPDYILVSHGHGDHLGDTVNIAKRAVRSSSAITRLRRTAKDKVARRIRCTSAAVAIFRSVV